MSRATMSTADDDKIPTVDATAGCKNPISVEKCERVLWVYEDNQMIRKPVTFVPGLHKIFDEILVNVALVAKESNEKTLSVTIDAESNCIKFRVSGVGIALPRHGINGDMKILTPLISGENWTEITLTPDLKVFNMPKLEDDVVALMKKRVVDIAGCLGKTVNVELDGKPFKFKSFSEYCQLYLNSGSTSKPLPRFDCVREGWQICITQSCGEFQQVSFVNGVATIEGGTHVDYVTNKIVKPLLLLLNHNKSKNFIGFHSSDVKDHLWVFVNAVIDNPAFDSQTGDRLTLGAANFGSSWEFPLNFLNSVAESDIVRNIQESKPQETLFDLEMYMHAHLLGKKATLILTHGNAGMKMATEARFKAGGLHCGVFSLSGELLNVREASNEQIMQNADFTNIREIVGLRTGVKYDDVNSLKYGRVMIMTHQDPDGSYMKALLINFFHMFWPALLKVPFLQEFKIPIVKAKHSDGKRIESFYTIPQYVTWKQRLKTDAKNWTIKYYERMETFTYDDVDEYFEHIDEHKRDFVWENDEDDEAEELAFSKKKIEARKKWLQNFARGTFLNPTEKKIGYRDFVNKELVYYFIRDNERSIPSVVDGMTPGQRAILVYLKRKPVNTKFRVPVLSHYVSCSASHYVSTCSAYRHGEVMRLDSTIIGMAQNYVGSNNINLLLPKTGDFGSRDKGGKDHGDPWCLFTQLSPMTTLLYPEEDDVFLTYLKEVGQSDEVGLPDVCNWFVPIIPMVLVNGCEGRSTLWSSSVPNYNPLDVIENIKRLLTGGQQVVMHPWYKGFNGSTKKTIEDTGASYTFSGNIEDVDKRNFRITELPIRMWTDDYDDFIYSVSADRNRGLKDPLVREVCNKSNSKKVLYTVRMSEKKLSALKKEGLLEKELKLTTSVGTSNMHLFDSTGVIQKYETPEEILEEFYRARLKIYEDRKAFVLAKLKKDKLQCENKCRFIDCVRNGKINLIDRETADLFRELEEKGFDLLMEKENISEAAVAGLTNEDEESVENTSGGYEYLLSLDIGTCDLEKMQAERAKLEKAVEDREKDTVKSTWMRDLDALQAELTKGGEYQKNRELMEVSAKATTETAAKPSLAGAKRRGPDSKQSPENKLRKMRESSFNKKNGSILARTDSDDEEEDASDELNDSESENTTDDGDDSDAEEDESDSSDESDDADDSDAKEEESDGSDE